MNPSAGVAADAGSLLPGIVSPPNSTIEPSWEPARRRLSIGDSLGACAFLIFYTAAYLAAGYAGVTFLEWMWMRVFG